MGILEWLNDKLQKFNDDMATREERVKNEKLAHKWAKELQKTIEKMSSAKSHATRVTNCARALSLLSNLERVDGATNLLQNKSEVRQQLEVLNKFMPLIALWNKAIKQHQAAESKKELKALIELQAFIQNEEPSDTEWGILEQLTGGAIERFTREKLASDIKELNSKIYFNLTPVG